MSRKTNKFDTGINKSRGHHPNRFSQSSGTVLEEETVQETCEREVKEEIGTKNKNVDPYIKTEYLKNP